ncbi:MAG: hypothetical protein HQL35_02400 [Alphaproteobacteria bacterium]|nr:hypothetical protein [Alphaproteobacteria bacterium]
MAGKRKSVVITPSTGARPWEIPALWNKVAFLQKIRLRRTVDTLILPLLVKLEGLYAKSNKTIKPRLRGRSLSEIEQDDAAIEWGLTLFDIAVREKLIEFKDAAGKAVTRGSVGCCGMSVDEAKDHFIQKALEHIMADAPPQKEKRVDEELRAMKVRKASDLSKVRQLIRFDPLSILELHKGLRGRLDSLLKKDKAFLDTLHACQPVTFLRPLRVALGNSFPEIVNLSPEFLQAVVEGLDHSAKITALGPEILSVRDPAVFRAFGTWAMKEIEDKADPEGKKKKYVTRISQVKDAMGKDFQLLLGATPSVVEEVGKWSNQEIEAIRRYLPFLGSEAIEAMSPIDFEMRVSMLHGLWDRLGREFIEVELSQPMGVLVIRGVVAKLQEMLKLGSAAKDVRSLIAKSEMLDDGLAPYLNRPKKKPEQPAEK